MSSTLSTNRSDLGMGSSNIPETDLVRPTLEILPNAPYLQVPINAQDRNIPPGAFVYFLLEAAFISGGGGRKTKRSGKTNGARRRGTAVR